ncbi:antirestriction protein [Sodalis endosymbiont of Spalangia cameroni]|uniref:antirestriction protein n=1 Tax=Sodalis praecaptivus TaxID=1239307 RepID=UPI0031F8C959
MLHLPSAALRVEESDRLSFLPYLFGEDFLDAEMQVYDYANRYLPEYNGGFWHFIRLPDGGGYMMPDVGPVRLVNDDNRFDRTVSNDVAGIILTSLVINHRCGLHHDRDRAGLVKLFIQREEQLWHHIVAHPECGDIYAALD